MAVIMPLARARRENRGSFAISCRKADTQGIEMVLAQIEAGPVLTGLMQRHQSSFPRTMYTAAWPSPTGTSEAAFPGPSLCISTSKRPVHVLDSHNLPIIFGELDTFFDLSTYFDAKVEAINRFDYLAYCGEEDLLAHYFLNFDRANNRHFIGTQREDINGVMIGEGEWKDFIQLDGLQAKERSRSRLVSVGRDYSAHVPERPRRHALGQCQFSGRTEHAIELMPAAGSAPINARIDEIVPRGEFASWRAARAVGDHDLNTFVIRADPVGTAGGSNPG
jgi:hypothetical protein